MSIHSRGVSPWLMPRSNRSTPCGTSANSGSRASLRISSRATSASRNSTSTPLRSAASILAWRSASRSRIGLASSTSTALHDTSGLPLTVDTGIYKYEPISTGKRHKARLFPVACAMHRKMNAGTTAASPDYPDEALILQSRCGTPEARSLALALGHLAAGLFNDGKANPGLVAVFLGDALPGLLGLLARLERALHLSRTFDQLVE